MRRAAASGSHPPGGVAIGEIVAQVTSATGLIFPASRSSTLQVSIERAMARAKEDDPSRYAQALRDDQALLDDLVSELTIGETYFFREPKQFDFLRSEVIPALIHREGRSEGVRAWSAGCATGEEAYSLAILLYEAGVANGAHVLGTDISRPRLARANDGVYRAWSLRGVRPEVVTRYFHQRDDSFVLVPEVRTPVEFRYLNLAEDSYPALSTGAWGMDIVLCRNVLIYFDTDTIARVALRLLASLSQSGWLLLGATDPPLHEIVPCEAVRTESGVAYRRAGLRRDRAAASSTTSSTSAVFDIPVTRPPAFVEPPAPLPVPTPVAVPLVVVPPVPTVRENNVPAEWTNAAAASAYAARDYERVAAVVRERILRDTADVRMWALLIRSLANLGRLSEAGAACAAALDRFRINAEIAYLHAVLLEQGCKYAAAAATARRALYLDRGMIVAHITLGTALARTGDVSGAARAFENATRLLAAMPREALVPYSESEPAGRLLEMTRAHAQLTARRSA